MRLWCASDVPLMRASLSLSDAPNAVGLCNLIGLYKNKHLSAKFIGSFWCALDADVSEFFWSSHSVPSAESLNGSTGHIQGSRLSAERLKRNAGPIQHCQQNPGVFWHVTGLCASTPRCITLSLGLCLRQASNFWHPITGLHAPYCVRGLFSLSLSLLFLYCRHVLLTVRLILVRLTYCTWPLFSSVMRHFLQ